MTLSEFFALIYGQGYRTIAFKKPEHKGFRHERFTTDDEAAKFALAKDAEGMAVYHACSTYLSMDNRKASNVQEVKAFWMDVDCGEGKTYLDQVDGMVALAQFRKDTGLPCPMIVSSGYGLHLYWPLLEALSPDEWLYVANGLKLMAQDFNFIVDPTRTADLSSVLRPPGTHNRKTTTEIPVKVLKAAAPVDSGLIKFIVEQHTAGRIEKPSDLGTAPDFARGVSSNELEAKVFDDAVYDWKLIATQCGAVGELAKLRGNMPEPAWYHTLGVVAHTTAPDHTLHDLSSGHPKYSKAETDAKLEQLRNVGPTTCKVLGSYFQNKCATCPHSGKIKSPIVLGKVHEVVNPETNEVADVKTGNPLFVAPPWMPYGFRAAIINGTAGLYYDKKATKDDDESGPIFVSGTVFYPVSALVNEDSKYEMRIRGFFKNGAAREFTLPNRIVGAGGRELAAALGEAQISVSETGQRYVAKYLRDWMAYQASEGDAISTYGRFGWHGDNFLVGETMYVPNETPRGIIPSQNMEMYSDKLVPRGNLDVWVQTIDELYNVPGREALQLFVLCAFAAPLVHLLGNTGGIFVYGHSDESGVGKTTAERAMLSVYGKWKGLETAYGRTTDNAFNDLIGVMGNLPVMIDEMTNIDTRKVSDFVHSISQGQSKSRLSRSGKLNTKNKTSWETIVVGSGNTRLSDKLASAKGNPDAEIARIFEFTLPALTGNMTVSEGGRLMRLLEENNGVAGQVYIQYLVNNADKVRNFIVACEKRLDNIHKFESSERYWSRLMSVVVAAMYIAKKLELVHFAATPMETWLGETLTYMRGNVKDVVDDVRSRFNAMYADLTPDMLITIGDGFGNSEPMVMRQPKGHIAGRVIISPAGPGAVACAPKLWITERAIRAWCNEQSVSYRQLLADFKTEGLLVGPARVSLGRGVQDHTAIKRERVIEFDPGLVSAKASGGHLSVVAASGP